ncbi:hypothetical protein B0H13DRAFT_1886058 [Mycena leptocephala]|nr:hypothetical protein B0H13DRAFT_1886058 [Mycena leptocephala]
MPPQPTGATIRLNNIITCLNLTIYTLETLASSLKSPLLMAIANTTQSLLKNMQTVKRNKNECSQMMEQTYELLNAILIVHIKSDTGGELPPSVLTHIGKFTETLHKIHTFVEAQQNGSKVKKFFRQGEMGTLLKDCKAGLQQGFEVFQVPMVNHMKDITQMQEDAEKRNTEVLAMIEAVSDTTSSDRSSSISGLYSGSHNSSNSISMLPSEPKIFHGRDSELSKFFTFSAKEHPGLQFWVQVEWEKPVLQELSSIIQKLLRGIISIGSLLLVILQQPSGTCCSYRSSCWTGASKDLTHQVIQHFSSSLDSLLILDNLETLWEPVETRSKIEEFLSLLTGVDHLALVLDYNAGSRKATKVAWTHPFLPALKPLEQDAARQTFIDIADSTHDPKEVDKVLSLTDNMPLAISLIAHLVDSEGCSHVLSHWEEEKTSLISDGYDRTSNLDLSISLSLSSPRLNLHLKDLLSLLSMLPDGLSDVELVQSKFPIDNIQGCKATLIRTALAYSDGHKRLKALVPIREYMQKHQPPGDCLIQPLLKHFQELLEFYVEYRRNQSSPSTVARVLSNYSNIKNVLQNGLQQGHPDLMNSIYCACNLNRFSRVMGQGPTSLLQQIQNILPHPCDHHLKTYFITECLDSWHLNILNAHTLVSETLESLKEFDDPDLKCRFYNVLATYYRIKGDISSAKKSAGTAIPLALATGNTKMHSRGLYNLAWVQWHLGDYFAAQMHAIEAWRLAIISADLYIEAQALDIEAICCYTLGNYTKAMSLCIRARELLGFCGMSHGELDHTIMNTQAEIHRFKSEYVEARSIHIRILEEASIQDPYNYGFASFNVAEIDVLIGAPKGNVQRNCDTARRLLNTVGNVEGVTLCDILLADLYLMEGNSLAAQTTFKRCLRVALDSQIQTYCLERLGDTSRWGCLYGMTSWTTVFLVHSLKRTEKLGIYKAFQFLGDVFLSQNDEHTATNLFTVALEGFTQMDVHRSRAECMLRFGDISMGHGDLLKAVEFWERARPLFERSSQAKQVQHIDERVANISKDVLEHHRNNLACLAELNAPAGTVEELEDGLSDIEDLNKVDIGEAKELGLIVV